MSNAQAISSAATSQLEKAASNDEAEVTYHQSIAELLLGVSAVVYTRNNTVYAQAEELYKSLATVAGELLPRKPFLRDLSAHQQEQFLSIFRESESQVHRLSAKLGLSSATISELDSGYGGPMASMLWPDSMDRSFLILAIKGTSVFDAREWLIDTALEKVMPSAHSETHLIC